MKIKSLLYALPALLLTSCFQGDNATVTDDANDAAGTGSPYLAREVVGVHLLSEDHRFGYDEPCNVLDEGFLQSMFDIKETDKLETVDGQNGCEFRWKGGLASISFGGPRPYQSMYHAEYEFNKRYQPGQPNQVSGQSGETSEKPALSGPNPEGTGAERPAIEPKGGAGADMDEDTSAANDSSDRVSGVTPAAAQFTKPAVTTGRFTTIANVGDKAVWEAAKNTMHVLYNNHIVSVRVETKGDVVARQQKAAALVNILLDRFSDVNADWN